MHSLFNQVISNTCQIYILIKDKYFFVYVCKQHFIFMLNKKNQQICDISLNIVYAMHVEA